jgi:hypothetical protein
MKKQKANDKGEKVVGKKRAAPVVGTAASKK